MPELKLAVIDVKPGAAMESQSGLQLLRPRIYGAWMEPPGPKRVAAIVMHPASNFMGHYLLAPLAGVPAEAVFIHAAPDGGETLVFNDGFMNLPARLPGFKGWVVKLIGSTGGPKVTWTARTFLVKDRRAYAAQLRQLAARPALARVVPGHGAVFREAILFKCDLRGVGLSSADLRGARLVGCTTAGADLDGAET